MPQALIAPVTSWVAGVLATVGASTAFTVAATGIIASAIVYGGLAAAAYLASTAFAPDKPKPPKPEDGKYNLKQSVPPLAYVLGEVKKAGDYAFLEEKGGVAYHILVHAAHHIKAYKEHYLHDEKAVFNATTGVISSPSHFILNGFGKVTLRANLGADAETAFAGPVSVFPSIWTNDHRGDGLASVMMAVQSVAAEDLQKVYPSGMPQHSSVIQGHDRLIDPRTGTAGYSTNLALFRYWHLTHPVGGKMTGDDLYTPDWANAADVCAQSVTNRSGGTENRYSGGLWFRADNDPVDVGRLMDQAAELVIYERADGKIGVHAGEFVTPDIRLTTDDLLSVSYDPNKRRATNVLAVRGRYTDPSKGYNTADAAIYGIPYPSDDERTKTVDNQAVQSHNHISRLQKLAYIRANAPRVRLVAHFDPARNVPYRRFVKVHYPPKLNEAIVEITGRPTLSLRNLTYTFDGIVVPAALYAFNAATEEGVPGASIVPVTPGDVPVPEDFAVTIQTEVVSGGSTAAFGLATFTHQDDTFQYELEWEPTSGSGTKQSTVGDAGEDEVRSLYLADGVEYKFRARTWSAGTSSDWTGYITLTATADPVAPGVVTGASAAGGAGQVTFNWTAPNSANYKAARLYINTVNTFGTATLVATEYGPPNLADSRAVTGITAGTYYGWVVAINGSGVASAAAATGTFTVT